MTDIVERLRNYDTCTDSDIDEAAALLARLPVDATGRRVVPGVDHVWCTDRIKRHVEWRDHPTKRGKHHHGWWTRPDGPAGEWGECRPSECYPTETAARAATAKEWTTHSNYSEFPNSSRPGDAGNEDEDGGGE